MLPISYTEAKATRLFARNGHIKCAKTGLSWRPIEIPHLPLWKVGVHTFKLARKCSHTRQISRQNATKINKIRNEWLHWTFFANFPISLICYSLPLWVTINWKVRNWKLAWNLFTRYFSTLCKYFRVWERGERMRKCWDLWEMRIKSVIRPWAFVRISGHINNISIS